MTYMTDTEFSNSVGVESEGIDDSVSTGNSEYKENYDTNNSPIRKSLVSKHRVKPEVKPSVPSPGNDDNLSMLELFDSKASIRTQMITHLQYLKSLKIGSVNINSLLTPKDCSRSLNVILRLFTIINVLNSLNNAINLYNFKTSLIINNCLKQLQKTNDLSFENTETSF